MKKLYRSALFAGVLAMGVAACGDDVTIIEPEPTPPPPLQVSMSPENLALNVGETAVFAVSVSGGAEGAQASWTCASSNTGVATVATSAAGCTVTAAGAGNASVTATVTKGNQTINAGGQVSVTAPPVATPATISINSVNQGGIPADLENIVGQVDVTLNVDPRDETIQRVVLFVDGVEVASQVFAAPVAGVEAEAAAETMQQVTLSFRSDFYALNMTSGMGVPRHLNGDRIISAALEVAESEADRPSNTVPVRFNNTSGFHVVTDVTEQNSAMDAQGRVWYGGPGFETTITAYPVLYSAGTVQSVTLNFCTSGSESTAPYTFSRTCTGTETIATGIVPMLSSIVSGNTGPTAILNGQARFGLAPHPFPVRIDRVAPGLGTGATLGVFEWRTDTAIQNRENWVNAQYRLDRTTVTAPTDVGVGMSTTVTNARTFVVRSAADTMVVLSEGSGNTAHASLDNSIDNNAYQLQQRWVDLLGNTRSVTVVASGSFTTIDDAVNNNTFGKATFGIDMEAPEAEIVSDFEDTETFLLLNGGETFDTEAVDVISGFAAPLSGHAFDHLLVRVNGTPGSSMLTRTSVASTGTISTTPFATSGADNTIAGLVPVTTYIRTPTSLDYSGQVGPTSDPGYFIYQARVRDKAGNTSPLMTRWVYNSENSEPEVSSVAVTTALQGGQPVAFPAVGSDDVELWQGSFDMDYAGARLVYNRPAPQISTLFDDVITIPAIFSFAADAFIRSLHVVDVLNAPTGVGAKPSIINAIAYNGWAFEADPSHVDASVGVSAANGNSNTFAAAVNAALVEDGVDWASMDAQLQINEWRPVSFSTGAVSGGNVTATVRVRARGPTSTFQNPFAAVLVVEADGAFITPLDIALTPNFNAPFPTTDSGTDRDYEWTFTITRPVGDVADLHVVGLNTGFDALATQFFTISFVASTPVTPLP